MKTIRKTDHWRDVRSEGGMAMMLSLFLITVLTVLGVMVINTAIVETKVARNQKVNSQVFYAAEAGLERGLKILELEMFNDAGAGAPWGNLNIAAPGFSVTATPVNGSTAMDPDERTMDMYLDGDSASGVRMLTFANGGDTIGNATYDLYVYSKSPGEVYLLSHAQSDDGAAAVEYHLRTIDESPYANAVYSGGGIQITSRNSSRARGRRHRRTTTTGNGSMTIAGSIYSMGNVHFSDGSKIVNNYLDGDIRPELQGVIGLYEDLYTQVRVKGGHLNMANDAFIGTDRIDPPGAVASIQVDGNFNSVEDYYAHEVGNEPPNYPMPNILHGLELSYPGVSDNAAYSGYSDDTEKAMAIYKDVIRGQGPFAPGATYAEPGATITSKGVVIDDNIITGCEKDKLDEDGGYQAENGEIDLDGTNPSFSCLDALGNGVIYDATEQHLTVIGMVMCDDEFEIDTDISFTAIGAYVDDGSGNPVAPGNQLELGATIVVGRSLEVNDSFLPYPPGSGGYVMGGDKTNSIGFVVGDQIAITATPEGVEGGTPGYSDALPVVTGYFFCPNDFTVQDQMQVAGAMIGGSFGLGGDVSVYHTPDLKNYIPPLMPGSEVIVTFRDREWRRVF